MATHVETKGSSGWSPVEIIAFIIIALCVAVMIGVAVLAINNLGS